MMKYFVIGAGSIGKRHAQNLAFLGADVTIIAFRDFDMANFISQLSSYNQNCAVVIATPTNIRMPLISQCARAGAALYIEKPLAYQSQDMDAIYNLPNATLKRSVAGFMMRYHPIIKKLLAHDMGDIDRASFAVGHDVNQWRDDWQFSKSYAANPDGGGVLLDLCHEIDIADLLCGGLTLKKVRSHSHVDFPEVDIESKLEFVTNNQANVSVAMDYVAPQLVRRGSLSTKTGHIDYDLTANEIHYRQSQQSHRETIASERNEMFLDLMQDFMCLAEGRAPLNLHVPRLDKVENVCRLIADAWQKREFIGTTEALLK